MVQGNERANPQALAGMDPIGESEYAQIVLTAQQARPREKPEEAALRGAEVIAAIGLMRDCLLRPREVLAARWSQLWREEDGSGKLTISQLKTTEFTVGYVSAKTMNALDDMRSARQALGTDDTDDRLFRMNRQLLYRRIRNACSMAGLDGRYGGNSPRIGMVQDMAMAGFSLVMIMNAGRWKSPVIPASLINRTLTGRRRETG